MPADRFPAAAEPRTKPGRHDTGQWEVHRLDLSAYLRRISYAGSLDPDAPTLTALHRAHIAAIPFENLDVMLGRGISVELDDIQAKLVNRKRGGYCYEHGLLFAAALEQLGYPVHRLLARTGDPETRPRPRSHLVLGVQASGQRWLADVGFGSGLLEPLPLAATGPRRQGEWTYQLVPGTSGAWQLRERQREEWVALYSFTEAPEYWVDIDVANYTTSTRPRSPFVQRPIVVRKDDTSVSQLLGRQFSVIRPGQPARERQLDDTEFAGTLHEVFGLALTPAETVALIATLAQDHAGQPPAPGQDAASQPGTELT
jgi:N-hydroxyarylamine O-acetyltransferase